MIRKYYISYIVFICVGACIHVTSVWEQPEGLGSLLPLCSSGDLSQDIKLGSKHLNPLSHLASPPPYFLRQVLFLTWSLVVGPDLLISELHEFSSLCLSHIGIWGALAILAFLKIKIHFICMYICFYTWVCACAWVSWDNRGFRSPETGAVGD